MQLPKNSSLTRCRTKFLHAIRSTAHTHACSSDSTIALQLLISTATIDLSRSTVAWTNRSGAIALLWYMLQYVSGSWEGFLSLAALMRSVDGADFVRRLRVIFVGRLPGHLAGSSGFFSLALLCSFPCMLSFSDAVLSLAFSPSGLRNHWSHDLGLDASELSA